MSADILTATTFSFVPLLMDIPNFPLGSTTFGAFNLISLSCDFLGMRRLLTPYREETRYSEGSGVEYSVNVRDGNSKYYDITIKRNVNMCLKSLGVLPLFLSPYKDLYAVSKCYIALLTIVQFAVNLFDYNSISSITITPVYGLDSFDLFDSLEILKPITITPVSQLDSCETGCEIDIADQSQQGYEVDMTHESAKGDEIHMSDPFEKVCEIHMG
jgi:hypothetical protein